MRKPFIDTYSEYGTVPTRQEIGDLDAHFRRRDALLRTLGIVPGFVAGREIAEFGPGSGENSIYFASLKPAHYTLVDGTEASVASVAAIKEKHYPDVPATVVHADFSEYRSGDGFDMVICEGAIPTQRDPGGMLSAIASHVRPGGVLICTCFDEVSVLPEMLRKILARIAIGEAKLSMQHIPFLVRLFEADLATLHGMTRRREDWVFDQIIHEWSGPPLSISAACDVLAEQFSPQGTSPRFFADWRWYKRITGHPDGFAMALKRSYLENLHNLLDWDHTLPSAPEAANVRLLAASTRLYEVVVAMESGKQDIDGGLVAAALDRVGDGAEHLHPKTKERLSRVTHGIADSTAAALGALAGWWGRGQQYISFVRHR